MAQRDLRAWAEKLAEAVRQGVQVERMWQAKRSFRNLKMALSLADECLLFDNTEPTGHRLVGLKSKGTDMLPLEPLPTSAEFLRA